MDKAILILDDEPNIRRDLGHRLEQKGFGVYKARSVDEAKKIIQSQSISYAIVDLKVDYQSEVGGNEVIPFVKRHQPKTKIIVLSGYDLSDVDIPTESRNQIDHFISKNGPENYISAVLKYLELEEQPVKKNCFVIMPFSSTLSCTEEEWTDIFSEVIKPAVEGSGYGYICTRSSPVQGNILEQMLDSLNRADIVVADLTDRNPNVFYELGVRHTLQDSTILIAQNKEDIPFDLRPYVAHYYSWKTKNDKEKFKAKIIEIIQKIELQPENGKSPVRKYLQI
jgi:ActR/RegA family two-component response regulator